MDGKVVHEWHRGFREIWPTPRRKSASPDSAIAWRYAELLPSGDIIVTIKSMGDTPDGYGLARLDKDSKVIWALPDGFNHHISVGKDGRIYGMIHEWRNTRERPVPGAAYLPNRVLEDFIVEVSPEGKIVWRASLLDAMATPEFRDLMGSAFFKSYNTKNWDRIHPNDIEVIEDEFASHHSFMKPGMLLISLRDIDSLVLFDPTTKAITWAMRGPWIRQHDPDLLGNGHILLFDNRGHDTDGSGSRIIEFDPASGKVLWAYAGTVRRPFRSDKAGGQERLPNGNTLISEDDGGRVFEVTTDGQIVWEYRDVRVHHAMRVAKDWLKFVPTPPALHDAVAASSRN
jgi:outer membrane protein assembly factor BamB